MEAQNAPLHTNVSYEQTGAAQEINKEQDLQQSLLKKQFIVQSLQHSVQEFKREKDELLISHVRNIVKQTY